MPFAETGIGELYYTESEGPEAAPAVVLVHGAGGSRLHWPAQLRRMPGATVYSLDLPGHGRSEGTGCDTIDCYVTAVTSFLDAVRVGSAVILGHSMGGAIAQVMGLDEPERVSSLVLVGTGARLRVDPAILEGIREDFDEVIDLITRYAWSPAADPSLTEVGRTALEETGPDVLLRDFLACDRFDVMDRVGEIGAPTLVIGGTADRLTPLKYSRYLGDQIPNARVVAVEGAGHMVMLEQPDEVGQAVRDFVGGGSGTRP